MGQTIFPFEETFQNWLPEELRDPKKRHSDYAEEVQEKVLGSDGFFLSIKPFADAVQAVRAMLEKGHDVVIFTPFINPDKNPVAYLQQGQLFRRTFAEEFFSLTFTTSDDQTVFRGDMLLSHNIRRGKIESPSYELVIVDSDYNRGISGKRRITWKSWREVLGI